MSIRKGNTLIAGNATFGYRPPLLQSFWSDHILNRVDLLRADTFSWQSGKMYKAVYKELVSEYDNENSVEETEGGITFKRTPNGYKIADSTQEQAILDKYNTHGIAWIYILDKGNTQFKLPRTKFGFEGVRNGVGNDIAESLPQHTHNVSIGSRAVYVNGGGANAQSQYGPTQYYSYTSTKANNSVYQDNAPVQERATQMYLYFYVGNYTQSAIEQTAGINSELFNNKVDLDAQNLSAEGKSLISGFGMPSSKYIDLTLSASGTTYTAPANGYFYLHKQVSGTGQNITFAYNGSMDNDFAVRFSLPATSGGMAGYIPCKKGTIVGISYNAGGATKVFRFYYAEGEQ